MDDLLALQHREMSLRSYRIDMRREGNNAEIVKIDKILSALNKNIESIKLSRSSSSIGHSEKQC